ncbi:MAG: prepilin-type N-terminal cleavage/methylation domain-containing protein, partial [Terriglobales bacterium]
KGSSSATISHESGHARPLGDEELKMRKQKGFSLIELLIVVAIILIIAAIAIPNLLRARIAANEASAAAGIRTINTAQVAFSSAFPAQGYAPNLVALGPAAGCNPPTVAGGCLLDDVMAKDPATKNGYQFAFIGDGAVPSGAYTVAGDPVTPNGSGVRSFCSYADAVVRFEVGALVGSCPVGTPPLQ